MVIPHANSIETSCSEGLLQLPAMTTTNGITNHKSQVINQSIISLVPILISPIPNTPNN